MAMTAVESLASRPSAARASLRYVRSSASKVRVVLDQIRGESYERAEEILKFSDRRIAAKVFQCLGSAAANAEHNRQIDSSELYVKECFADEGPSIKRWRPRARGRATPILKRTCHITVVLGRYLAEERAARATQSTVEEEARRRRVAASRAAQARQGTGADSETVRADDTDAGVGDEDDAGVGDEDDKKSQTS